MLVEIAVALLVGVGIVAAPPSVRSHYQYSYIWSEPPWNRRSFVCFLSFSGKHRQSTRIWSLIAVWIDSVRSI
ncbi:hypothetical protein Lser_V15G13077 [Lactuca serriola]